MATWAIANLSMAWRYRHRILVPAATTVIVGLGLLSWIQDTYWRDSERLWAHTLAVTSDNDFAHASHRRLNEFSIGFHLYDFFFGSDHQMHRDCCRFIDIQRDAILKEFLKPRGGDFQLIVPDRKFQQYEVARTIGARASSKPSLYLPRRNGGVLHDGATRICNYATNVSGDLLRGRKRACQQSHDSQISR